MAKLHETLYDFVPIHSVVEDVIISYFNVTELAGAFIVSGATKPDLRVWERIYKHEYAYVYAKVGMSRTEARRYIENHLHLDTIDEVTTVLIMVGLILFNTVEMWFKVNEYPNDLNFRLFVQTYTGQFRHIVQLIKDRFSVILGRNLYSGLAYVIEKDTSTLPDNPMTIIRQLAIGGHNEIDDFTDLTRSSFETVIKVCVSLYLKNGQRPLDLPVNLSCGEDGEEAYYTLFEVCVENMPQLALFFVETYAPYTAFNLLHIHVGGVTYAHLAADREHKELYVALMKKEPLLSAIKDVDGQTPSVIFERSLERKLQSGRSRSRKRSLSQSPRSPPLIRTITPPCSRSPQNRSRSPSPSRERFQERSYSSNSESMLHSVRPRSPSRSRGCSPNELEPLL